MSDKTLYDILEVSQSASPESIRAAYDRLSAKLTPLRDENKANADINIQYIAVKEAFLTLSNPSKRALYDKKIAPRAVITNVEIVEPFWTTTKMLLVVLFLSFSGYLYYNWQINEAQAEADKAIAEAKAKSDAEQALAEAQEAQAAYQQKLLEDRQRNQEQADFRRFDAQQQFQDRVDQFSADREEIKQKIAQQQADAQHRRDEAQAANAARLQLMHDKAELCQKEYQNYGHSVSCN
jgi:curved DNA-binding protein CbpA